MSSAILKSSTHLSCDSWQKVRKHVVYLTFNVYARYDGLVYNELLGRIVAVSP